jgi:NADH:ubiquinone oxidoreductase subunit E
MDEKGTICDPARIAQIVEQYRDRKWPLIPILQEIQNDFGYIPPETVEPVARALNMFPSQVQGVITFYEQFYTQPRGKKIVRVCRGTACHVRGGKTILKLAKQHLGIDEGQTTADFEYTLDTVACIGVCAMAPNMVIDKQTYGHLNPKKVGQLLSHDKREEA